MSVARTRRDSARETASITRMLQFLDWPDLDHADARRWEPRGDRAGLIHVLGLDDEESTQLLLCLDKWADGGGDVAGADADGAGRPGPLESVRDDVVAAPSDLLGILDRGVDKSLHLLLGHRVQHVLVVVDHEHELHRILLRGEAFRGASCRSRQDIPGSRRDGAAGLAIVEGVTWRGVRARGPRC